MGGIMWNPKVIYKADFELLHLNFDFRSMLVKEKIKKRVLTAIDLIDGSDALLTVLDPSKQIDEKQASQLCLIGGKIGHRYEIEMSIVGTKGSKAILTANVQIVAMR